MKNTILPYFNRHLYTDIIPYELVEVLSSSHLMIREMNTKKSKDFTLEMVPGGFVGFPLNQDEQKWDYFSNEDYPVISIHLNNKGQWLDESNQQYQPNSNPIKFYDYSF